MAATMTQIERFQAVLREASFDGFLISDLANVRWLTEFSGSFGYVVVTSAAAVMVTDSRYTLQASEEVDGMPVRTFASPTEVGDFLYEQVQALGIRTLGFDESNVTVLTHRKWQERFNGVELVPSTDPCTALRKVKIAAEVDRIRVACGLVDDCLELLAKRITPGQTEQQILWWIQDFLREASAEMSFDPIVLSGPRSARPHGTPSERKIESGDLLLIDFGALLDGYCSDITRTFVIGKASERQREVYGHVLRVEQECVERLRPGANGRDLHQFARDELESVGLGQYFGHGLGHGLGVRVHDSGRLSVTVDEPIVAGQVWTVEPGVYIENFGGIRIEDDVVVTEGEPEVLTRFPRDLIEL